MVAVVSVHAEGLSCKPVGFVRSCYRERNGTPRQGCLVPDGRGVLVFRPELNPVAMTDGLAEFSHVWLVVRRRRGAVVFVCCGGFTTGRHVSQ